MCVLQNEVQTLQYARPLLLTLSFARVDCCFCYDCCSSLTLKGLTLLIGHSVRVLASFFGAFHLKLWINPTHGHFGFNEEDGTWDDDPRNANRLTLSSIISSIKSSNGSKQKLSALPPRGVASELLASALNEPWTWAIAKNFDVWGPFHNLEKHCYVTK